MKINYKEAAYTVLAVIFILLAAVFGGMILYVLWWVIQLIRSTMSPELVYALVMIGTLILMVILGTILDKHYDKR
jgi:hypothetical protein